MIDYTTLKRLAKEYKTTVKNLVALSVQNDPFYVGAPAQLAAAEWFAGLWHQFNFTQGVHLRRIHYQLISQETAIIMSNGKPYINTVECWKILNEASKAARYLNLVDIDAFNDRRNPPAVINEPEEFTSGFSEVIQEFSVGIEMPELPRIAVYGADVSQRYLVEVWCEKSTMNDILEPICRQQQTNLVTGLGELSITRVNELVHRIEPESVT